MSLQIDGIPISRGRGQDCLWLFRVGWGKGRFRKRESLLRSAANDPEQKARLECEIYATDQRSDQLVDDLYDLTEEEIKIVEEGTST